MAKSTQLIKMQESLKLSESSPADIGNLELKECSISPWVTDDTKKALGIVLYPDNPKEVSKNGLGLNIDDLKKLRSYIDAIIKAS